MTSPFCFTILHTDRHCGARCGKFATPHGSVLVPAFMPVATQGTVKGLDSGKLASTGTQMVLGNAYHLALRPGEEVVAALGGLHRFMRWDGPILTDSGGFQVFSLAHRPRIVEEHAVFRSHIDGREVCISPERAVQIQELLGSDVAMVLDHVVALPNERSIVRDAAERSVRWARRCRDAATRDDQALFGIVQGGLDVDLRCWCAEQTAKLDMEGYAVGGLSVGEPPAEMYRVLDATVPLLPADRPRYLMGVGRPLDLLEGIRRGIDLFDCVMPTRNGRNALAFTDQGPLRLRNRKFEQDPRPLEPGCPCDACKHSRGYLRHLFLAREMLGPILLSLHNVTYYQRLLADARRAISEDRFELFMQTRIRGWGSPEEA